MKPAQSITWLPEAVGEDLAAEVDRLLSDWAAPWGIASPGPARVALVPAGDGGMHDVVDLLSDLPTSWKRALAQSLFRFDAYGSPLVDGVLDTVVTALRSCLRAAFGESAVPDPSPMSIGHAGVRVTVELLGQQSGFVLSCAQLQASGKLKRPTPEALGAVDIEHALSGVPVPLTAELGRAEVNLEELMQLSPGDVLLLHERLDSPLRVVSPGSSLALPAHLGLSSLSARRAVRWLPPSSASSPP